MLKFKNLFGKIDAGAVVWVAGMAVDAIGALINKKNEDKARENLKNELRKEILKDLSKKNG